MRFVRMCAGVCLASLIVLSSPGAAQNLKDKQVADSAPFIKAALTEPMADLYAQAMRDKRPAELTLAVALFAGRTVPGVLDSTELGKLEALDARIKPLYDDYRGKHPKPSSTLINWREQFHLTRDETKLIETYQQAKLADYWFSKVANDGNGPVIIMSARPTLPSFGIVPGPRISGGYAGWNTAYIRTFFGAAHCVSAVRQKVGLDYANPRNIPFSLVLMRNFPLDDMQAKVDDGIAKYTPDKPYYVGEEACGTHEQFNTYVEMLKAASKAAS